MTFKVRLLIYQYLHVLNSLIAFKSKGMEASVVSLDNPQVCCPVLPNNIFTLYRYEWVPPKMALPHLLGRFTRGLHVNEADLRFYPEIPRLPHIDTS